MENNEPKIIQTDEGNKDGQNKCPKCGATEISLNPTNGTLRCKFCRHEFEPEKAMGLDTDLSQLEGKVVGSGAQNIIADTKDVLTFKCSSCAAEVVIDTTESTQARCHWCRNTLSVNQQIPNGAVPDMVLPFSVKREDARVEIEKFITKRKFFAHPKFKEEFCSDNVMGVYLPYMVIGLNSSAKFSGRGERLVRRYTVGSGKQARVRFDADLYNVEREFDLVIDGLKVISSSDKLSHNSSNQTNNIINAIKPFDNENCVKWDANYLKGYASEKRDTNIEDLKSLVKTKATDIARHNANDTLTEYDRGVQWTSESLDIKGQQWKAAYLPIWLYSYQQVKGASKKLHYVAVNARTKKAMGSVPINMPKLLLFSLIAQIIGIIGAVFGGMLLEFDLSWLLLGSGVLYFAYYLNKYRNARARFSHEKETNAEMSNVRKKDTLIKRLTGLSNASMQGANNRRVNANQSGIMSQINKLK